MARATPCALLSVRRLRGRRARTPFRPRNIYVAGLLSVPALLPKSGVVPGLCPRPHYLSAGAYRYPRRILAPVLFGRCLRCRSSTIVVRSSLSALPCGIYVDKRLCSQAPGACTTGVVSTAGAPIPRPIMLKGPHFPFSLSPRLRRSRQRCGGQGRAVSPSLPRAHYFSAGALGWRAGLVAFGSHVRRLCLRPLRPPVGRPQPFSPPKRSRINRRRFNFSLHFLSRYPLSLD